MKPVLLYNITLSTNQKHVYNDKQYIITFD